MATKPGPVSKGGKYGDLKRRLLFLLGALIVYRIGAHIPVPGIDPQVPVSYTHLDVYKRQDLTNGGNIGAAAVIGKLIAERAKKAGIEQVAFDRGGFQYHGRVKALAEAAREAGLKF